MGMFDSFYIGRTEWQTKALDRMLWRWNLGDAVVVFEREVPLDYQVEAIYWDPQTKTAEDSYAVILNGKFVSVRKIPDPKMVTLNYLGDIISYGLNPIRFKKKEN